jgi:hypothetical protein
MKYLIFSAILCLLGLIACKKKTTVDCIAPIQKGLLKNKMCGMSFTAPKDPFVTDPMLPLEELGINWVSCLPFSIFYKNQPKVHAIQGGWWGETSAGIAATINYAHSRNIKVMLKPQLWNWEQWIGEFDLQTETEWDTFEQSYTKFIMRWARLADSMEVELFCIGTEIKNSVEKRPDY